MKFLSLFALSILSVSAFADVLSTDETCVEKVIFHEVSSQLTVLDPNIFLSSATTIQMVAFDTHSYHNYPLGEDWFTTTYMQKSHRTHPVTYSVNVTKITRDYNCDGVSSPGCVAGELKRGEVFILDEVLTSCTLHVVPSSIENSRPDRPVFGETSNAGSIGH